MRYYWQTFYKPQNHEAERPQLQIPLAPPEWYIRKMEIEKTPPKNLGYEVDYTISEEDESPHVIILEM